MLQARDVRSGEIDRVIGMLKNLAGDSDSVLEGEAMGWMKTRVEFTNGKEKYLLGNQSMLAEDIVEFLRLYNQRSDLSANEKAYLIEEYVLHEVMENTTLDHGTIIELTTRLFGRGEMGIDFTRPGETPLGTALRSFLDIKLLTSSASGVLLHMRPGRHPNITLIPVKGDQLLWDGSTFNKLKSSIGRVVSRKYGVNNYIFYYDVDAADPEAEIGEIMKRVEKITGFNDNNARLMAYADSSHATAMTSKLESMVGEDKLTGVVLGNFKGVTANERMSVVTLEVLGLGLMEWDRADAAKEDKRQEGIADSLLELLVRVSDNPGKIRDYMAKECAGDPGKFMKNLISGNFNMTIKKIDFEEIRDFMESEAAILQSL